MAREKNESKSNVEVDKKGGRGVATWAFVRMAREWRNPSAVSTNGRRRRAPTLKRVRQNGKQTNQDMIPRRTGLGLLVQAQAVGKSMTETINPVVFRTYQKAVRSGVHKEGSSAESRLGLEIDSSARLPFCG